MPLLAIVSLFGLFSCGTKSNSTLNYSGDIKIVEDSPAPELSNLDPRDSERINELSVFVKNYKKRYRLALGLDLNEEVTFDFKSSFRDLPKNTLGECTLYTNVEGHIIKKEIHYDRKEWDTGDDKQRAITVFHEIGHCHLLRRHSDGSIKVEDDLRSNTSIKIYPDSIMTSKVKSSVIREIFDYFDPYSSELFLKNPSPIILKISSDNPDKIIVVSPRSPKSDIPLDEVKTK